MWIFRSATPRQLDLGLLILRIVAGTIFIAHGAQKLFVYGLDGVAGAFAGMGIPMAGLMGPSIALLEFFGGMALILGLLTRLAAAGLAADMLGAMLFVHLSAGFFLPNGIEFALALLGSVAPLAFLGAGRYSVDSIIGRRPDSAESVDRAHLADRRRAA